MSDVEEGIRNPKEIALAVFRFRARRGVGVFYTLFTLVPLVQGILASFSVPGYVQQLSTLLVLILIYIAARMAGLQKFYRMMSTIDLYEGKNENSKGNGKLSRLIKEWLSTPVLPLIIIGIIIVVGIDTLALGIALVWVGIGLYSNIKAYSKRNKDSILNRQAEDWLAVSSLPLIVILAVLHLSPIVVVAIVAPLWLAAGIWSLYEAPQELVRRIE